MAFNKITTEQTAFLKTLPVPNLVLVLNNRTAHSLAERFQIAMKRAGWKEEDCELIMQELLSGDCDHMWSVAREFTEISIEGCAGDDI